MRRWQRMGLVLVCSLMALSRAGTAQAQGGGSSLSILSDVLVKVFVIVDEVLGFFVSGNALTDPKGEDLAAALATIVHNIMDFVAQFSILLTGNSAT
jgi:hypothetical protein